MSFCGSEINKNIQLWLEGDFPSAVKAKIRRLQSENPQELEDAFYTNLAFGTGGLRGIMGIGCNRMNEWTVALATQGFANYILQNFSQPKVAIAYDVRHNSSFFARRVAEVFSANGIEVYLFSAPRPTPLLSFSIRQLTCQAGVVITASHNPKEYNGYKVYWEDGAQVTPPHDERIIQEVNKLSIDGVKTSYKPELIHSLGTEMDNLYLEMVLGQIIPPSSSSAHRENLRIVYTPLHGTGISLLPKLLQKLGFSDLNIPEEQIENSGDFPTVSLPNPEDPQAMSIALGLAKAKRADVVFATDPDADRIGVGIALESGEYLLLNGNQTAALLFDFALKIKQKQGQLTTNSYILKTIVTSELLNKIAEHYGVNCYDTLTGFKWMAKIIREKQGLEEYIVGGEESFGILLGDKVRDKDGISAIALFAEMFAQYKAQAIKPLEVLENLYRSHGFFYEALYSVTKTGRQGAESIKAMMEKFRHDKPREFAGIKIVEFIDYSQGIRQNLQTGESFSVDIPRSNVLQFILADNTKISMRPSGTEPKIKFYLSVFEEDYNRFANYFEAVAHAERKIKNYLNCFEL